MVVNPYKDEMMACKFIDRSLTKDLKNIPEGMPMNEIILQVKLLYPVSRGFVEKWVKEMYIDLKLVEYDDLTTVIKYKEAKR